MRLPTFLAAYNTCADTNSGFVSAVHPRHDARENYTNVRLQWAGMRRRLPSAPARFRFPFKFFAVIPLQPLRATRTRATLRYVDGGLYTRGSLKRAGRKSRRAGVEGGEGIEASERGPGTARAHRNRSSHFALRALWRAPLAAPNNTQCLCGMQIATCFILFGYGA